MAPCDEASQTTTTTGTTTSASSPTAADAAAADSSAMITLPKDQSPTASAAEAKNPSFSSGTRRLGSRGLGSFKLFDCTDDNWQEGEAEADEPTGAHLLQTTASGGAPIAGQGRITAWVRQSGLSLLPPPPLDKECRGRRNVLEEACYRIVVDLDRNACFHLHVEALLPVAPEVAMRCLTLYGEQAVLRDLRRAIVVREEERGPGVTHMEVLLANKVKVLWGHKLHKTWLTQQRDMRDPHRMQVAFRMDKSENFARFQGSSTVEAVSDPSSGKVVGCRLVQQQQVVSKAAVTGVAKAIFKLPGIGHAIRGVTVRVMRRLVEDMYGVVHEIQAGLEAGGAAHVLLAELAARQRSAASAQDLARFDSVRQQLWKEVGKAHGSGQGVTAV